MTDEINPHPPESVELRGLGDVRREMSKVYSDMRWRRVPCEDGSRLINALNCIAGVMQDARDSKWTKRAELLWKEREARSTQPAAVQ